QAEQADQVGGIGEIERRQEARVQKCHDGADHQDQQEQAEVFLQHDLLSQFRVLPTASCSTLCSLNRSRSRKPEMRPSCITAMRSETPMTSSMSLEIISTATPLSARLRINW